MNSDILLLQPSATKPDAVRSPVVQPPRLRGRYRHDLAALILHMIATAVIIACWTEYSVLKPKALAAFLAQEAIAIVAHVYYLFQYRRNIPDWWNETKWLEYSFSATAGTIGTFFAGVEPGSADAGQYVLIVILLALGFTRQRIGHIIDAPPESNKFDRVRHHYKFILFAVAFIFQVIENAIVIYQDPPSFIVPVYVIMWSLFGIHAGFRLYAITMDHFSSSFLRPWKSTYWTEMVYSYLGWTAKIAVLLVAVPDTFVHLSTSETGVMYGVMAVLLLSTFAGLIIIYRSYKS